VNKAPYQLQDINVSPLQRCCATLFPAFFPLPMCLCPFTHAVCTISSFPLARQQKKQTSPIMPRTNTTPHLTIYRVSPPMQSTIHTFPHRQRLAQTPNRCAACSIGPEHTRSAQNKPWPPYSPRCHVDLTQKANLQSPTSTLRLFGLAAAHPSASAPQRLSPCCTLLRSGLATELRRRKKASNRRI
jgi:hypothetical protein